MRPIKINTSALLVENPSAPDSSERELDCLAFPQSRRKFGPHLNVLCEG